MVPCGTILTVLGKSCGPRVYSCAADGTAKSYGVNALCCRSLVSAPASVPLKLRIRVPVSAPMPSCEAALSTFSQLISYVSHTALSAGSMSSEVVFECITL